MDGIRAGGPSGPIRGKTELVAKGEAEKRMLTEVWGAARRGSCIVDRLPAARSGFSYYPSGVWLAFPRMAKPTLLQSLLGRPSQSYAFPRERQRYSSKRDLARALASSSPLGMAEVAEVAPPLSGVERFQKGKGKASYARLDEDIPLPVRSPQQIKSDSISISSGSGEDSDEEVFYTPCSSPPTSMLIDPPIPFLPPDPSSSSASSSSSSSTSHSVLSCSTPPTSDELHAAFAAVQKRPARQSRSKRVSTPSRSYAYTDEDWAKEFRWLVQPSTSAPKSRTSLSMDVAQSTFPPTVPHRPKPRPRPRTVISRPITSHRMTALLEEDEDATDDLRSTSPQSHLTDPFSPPLSRTNSITSNTHDVRSAPHTSRSRISLSSRTVELPQFPSSSAPGPAPGYTTLTLPRASYLPEDPWRSLGGGHVNLPRDGRAQTSMVSVEVVRGAVSTSFLYSGFRKRNSASPPHMKHDLADAIALSSHRPPPSFVPNSGVLVQVHAIGLEGLDKQIVLDKLAVSDAGGKGAISFVPGRGVMGRVVECGLEVQSDTLKKGEWVIGLLDAKKVRCHRVFLPGVLLY
jgi:hypothetical protein